MCHDFRVRRHGKRRAWIGSGHKAGGDCVRSSCRFCRIWRMEECAKRWGRLPFLPEFWIEVRGDAGRELPFLPECVGRTRWRREELPFLPEIETLDANDASGEEDKRGGEEVEGGKRVHGDIQDG